MLIGISTLDKINNSEMHLSIPATKSLVVVFVNSLLLLMICSGSDVASTSSFFTSATVGCYVIILSPSYFCHSVFHRSNPSLTYQLSHASGLSYDAM